MNRRQSVNEMLRDIAEVNRKKRYMKYNGSTKEEKASKLAQEEAGALEEAKSIKLEEEKNIKRKKLFESGYVFNPEPEDSIKEKDPMEQLIDEIINSTKLQQKRKNKKGYEVIGYNAVSAVDNIFSKIQLQRQQNPLPMITGINIVALGVSDTYPIKSLYETYHIKSGDKFVNKVDTGKVDGTRDIEGLLTRTMFKNKEKHSAVLIDNLINEKQTFQIHVNLSQRIPNDNDNYNKDDVRMDEELYCYVYNTSEDGRLKYLTEKHHRLIVNEESDYAKEQILNEIYVVKNHMLINSPPIIFLIEYAGHSSILIMTDDGKFYSIGIGHNQVQTPESEVNRISLSGLVNRVASLAGVSVVDTTLMVLSPDNEFPNPAIHESKINWVGFMTFDMCLRINETLRMTRKISFELKYCGDEGYEGYLKEYWKVSKVSAQIDPDFMSFNVTSSVLGVFDEKRLIDKRRSLRYTPSNQNVPWTDRRSKPTIISINQWNNWNCLAWALYILKYPKVNCGGFDIGLLAKDFWELIKKPEKIKFKNLVTRFINPFLNSPMGCKSIDQFRWENFVRAYIKHNKYYESKESKDRRNLIEEHLKKIHLLNLQNNSLSDPTHITKFDRTMDLPVEFFTPRNFDLYRAVGMFTNSPPDTSLTDESSVVRSSHGILAPLMTPIRTISRLMGIGRGKTKDKGKRNPRRKSKRRDKRKTNRKRLM